MIHLRRDSFEVPFEFVREEVGHATTRVERLELGRLSRQAAVDDRLEQARVGGPLRAREAGLPTRDASSRP